jgi:hypothetical protein
MAEKTLSTARKLEAYRTLDRPLALVVELLAVARESLARSHMVPCLRELGKAPRKRAWTTVRISPVLETLEELGVMEPSGYIELDKDFRAVLLDHLEAEGRLWEIAEVVQRHRPVSEANGRDQWERLMRDVDLALRGNDGPRLVELHGLATSADLQAYRAKFGVFNELWPTGPDDRFERLEPNAALIVACDQAQLARLKLADPHPWLERLVQLSADCDVPLEVTHEVVRQFLLRGHIKTARRALQRLTDRRSRALAGWAALVAGEPEAAQEAFAEAKGTGRRRAEVYAAATDGPEVIFLALAMLQSNSPEWQVGAFLAELDGMVEPRYACAGPLKRLMRLLGPTSQVQATQFGESDRWDFLTRAKEYSDWYIWLYVMVFGWAEKEPFDGLVTAAADLLERASAAGYRWLAAEVASALAPVTGDEDYRDRARTEGGPEWRPVASLFSVEPKWQRILRSLEAAVAPPAPPPPVPSAPKKKVVQPTARLAWMIFESKWGGRFELEPREQRLGKNGTWSKGRKIALKRLHGYHPEIAFVTEKDLPVCRLVDQHTQVFRGYPDISYSVDTAAALEKLAGHPFVFWRDDPCQPLTISSGEPELHVVRDNGAIRVRLEPDVGASPRVIEKDGPYSLRVVKTKEIHRKVGEIVGEGIEVPADAADRIEAFVATVADRLSVHTDLGTTVEAVQSLEADPRTVVQLTRVGDGLLVRLRARPLGPQGPVVLPGLGPPNLVSEIGKERVSAQRDLAEETAQAQALQTACPLLLAGTPGEAQGEWLIDDIATALGLIHQLEHSDSDILLEWADNRQLHVLREVSAEDLKLEIQAGREGFTIKGGIPVDDENRLELHRVINLLDASPGRFIKLDEERFVALTGEFHRLLNELAHVARPSGGRRGGDGLVVNKWAAESVEKLAQQARALRASAAWQKHLDAFRRAREHEALVPSTFQAELRDYQFQGFQWLARLAELGVGACLADDMGLGKTVQTLALLVARAPVGPALVACPTSVVDVWFAEARRFAPTLRLVRFGSGDRAAALKEAGPFDVLVTSHALLGLEADRLGAVKWATVVVDEAQALKNPQTQRAKAAFGLRAGFRVALTGTPVENRLDDLWSIFRFVIPGLLSSLESFRKRFARPIEQGQSSRTRQALRQIVRPFMLRRTKAAVLDQLPPKTEMSLAVELSAEEAALYEATRRRALESLAFVDQDSPLYMRVLAEITRLRRLCCDARLVVPAEDAPPSSKQQVFGELLDQLLAGGHKALVFSQFVDHLNLVRDLLQERGVTYHLLQGSTPEGKRRAQVAAFQAGEGDVFLISLRAGGTGLNLTAADYVVHLDPWWNPAVEDQASDRAHRIGQDRPVTVVRLVTRGTIEEKILALHRQKRDLAERLLEGTDLVAPLDAEALLALLAENDSNSSRPNSNSRAETSDSP